MKQTEEKVLRPDVVVAQLQGLVDGPAKHCLRPRGEGKLSISIFRLSSAPDESKNALFSHGFREAFSIEDALGHAIGGFEQSKQNVLGSHETVPQTVGFCLGLAHHCPGPFRESSERRHIEREPLVSRLLADPESAADLGPGMSAPPALVHKMTEECVADLFEIAHGLRRLGQLEEGLLTRCVSPHSIDQFLQSR